MQNTLKLCILKGEKQGSDQKKITQGIHRNELENRNQHNITHLLPSEYKLQSKLCFKYEELLRNEKVMIITIVHHFLNTYNMSQLHMHPLLNPHTNSERYYYYHLHFGDKLTRRSYERTQSHPAYEWVQPWFLKHDHQRILRHEGEGESRWKDQTRSCQSIHTYKTGKLGQFPTKMLKKQSSLWQLIHQTWRKFQQWEGP